MASGKHRGIHMPNPLDTEGLSSEAKILKLKATKLPVKAVPEILPRVYPPPRRTSCTRCFPDGCGRKAAQSGNGDAQQANPSKSNGLEIEISCLEAISFEQKIKSDTHKSKIVADILSRAYPPRRRISATRCFPKDCGRRIFQAQASEKVGQEILASTANDSISQCGSMNQQQGEVPISLKLPVCSGIVLGLMASVEFTQRQ